MITNFDKDKGIMVCIPEEDITVENSPQINKDCEKIIDDGVNKLVVNLSKVKYVDSSGLATLVAVLKKLKSRQGQLKISHMPDKVRGLFEITKLDKLFNICENDEEAINSFSTNP